jgi:hypothetical protein
MDVPKRSSSSDESLRRSTVLNTLVAETNGGSFDMGRGNDDK